MAMESRFPAEWEPLSGVILAWPHAGTDWAPRLAEVERAYVGLVSAVARFEPVLLCVADAQVEARARELLDGHVEADRVTFARLPYDDTWLRDSGPITLHEGERFRLLDFHFTAWGGKFEAALDDLLVEGLQLFLEAVQECPKSWQLILLPPEGVPAVVHERTNRTRRNVLRQLEKLVAWGIERRGGPTLDSELFARLLMEMAEDSARLILTQPEKFTVERIIAFARTLVTAFNRPSAAKK
jgi:hypothetical protein